jgi:hypothetical protein
MALRSPALLSLPQQQAQEHVPATNPTLSPRLHTLRLMLPRGHVCVIDGHEVCRGVRCGPLRLVAARQVRPDRAGYGAGNDFRPFRDHLVPCTVQPIGASGSARQPPRRTLGAGFRTACRRCLSDIRLRDLFLPAAGLRERKQLSCNSMIGTDASPSVRNLRHGWLAIAPAPIAT